MLLSPKFLDELRARTTLSALIGRSVKLVRAGREFKACCPFHQEKTPSFWVNDEKGFYHCFGCSAHGDAIRFLTEAQGLGFMDAVKELAANAGMELPAPDPRARERAERATGLIDVTARAERWFAEQLDGIGGAEARDYLTRRRLTARTAREFGLGFAPEGRAKLKAALADIGEPLLTEAGLLIEVEGKERYDRFRQRLMIPIRDARGRTIAFGGRIIGEGEPKYLNSPETPLFDKGRTLYNLDKAGPAARKAGRVLVVEGYLDVIGLAQAGIAEAVAPLGTALTEQQMALLWRVVDVPVLCFDGDKAGQKAAVRAATRALPLLRLGKSLSFAVLPAGKDPDDLVRDGGAAAFETAIAKPVPLVELLYRAERETADPNSPDDRARLRGALNALADSCTDKLVAEEYRRSFNSLFFEEFGWKQKQRSAVADAIVSTSPNGKKAGSYKLLIRSLLYGLTRYPAVALMRVEEISNLRISDPVLSKWRATILDTVTRNNYLVAGHPDPDDDAIKEIFEADLVPEQEAYDLRRDLRFSFTDDRFDPAVAVTQLVGLIELLSEEADLNEELSAIHDRMRRDVGLAQYDALAARKISILDAMQALKDRASEYGSLEATLLGDLGTQASGRN